jgi:heme-degrading monooxygenase HmoA
MFARVSTYRGAPSQLDAGARIIEQTGERVRGQAGFKGAYLLVDRQSGKCVTITLWESEQAVRESAAAANPLRDQVAQALGAAEPATVEVYEVAVQI